MHPKPRAADLLILGNEIVEENMESRLPAVGLKEGIEMSEIVERVARALCTMAGEDADIIIGIPIGNDGTGPVEMMPTWKAFEDRALAAIEAIPINIRAFEHFLTVSVWPVRGSQKFDTDAEILAWGTGVQDTCAALRQALSSSSEAEGAAAPTKPTRE